MFQTKNTDHLKDSLIGKLRLKLFKEITGNDEKIPSVKQAISYIKSMGNIHFPFLEFFTYLLTNAAYSKISQKKLTSSQDLGPLFESLDKYPLTEPALFQVNDFLDEKEVAVWINCHELKEGGHFYEIIICEEFFFPQEVIFYLEVRTSQLHPEPAFVYYDDNAEISTIQRHNDTAVFKNPMIVFGIKLLKYINDKYLGDPIIPVERIVKSKKYKKLRPKFNPPVDKMLDVLINKVMMRESTCSLAEVPMKRIVPHSYDFCFDLPLHYISRLEKYAEKIRKDGLLVYWNGTRFIMSDDYLAYMTLRKLNYQSTNVVILGNQIPDDVEIIKHGGIELFPPVMALPFRGYDALDIEMKEIILGNYIDRLRSIEGATELMTAKCLVLTEDKKTDFIESILEASGFFIEETLIVSYKDCTNLNSLDLNISTIKSVNERIRIVIHRDKDYLQEEKIAGIRNNILKAGAFPFITVGTDIESYYINTAHIHSLYPQISITEIEDMIESVNFKMRDCAIESIKKSNINGMSEDQHKISDVWINDYYQANIEKLRPGKKAYGLLKGMIQKKIKSNPKLIVATKYIKDFTLEKYASIIWP